MKRIPVIAGNWKMNTGIDDAVKLVKTMLPDLEKFSSVEKVVCPPFVSLDAVNKALKESSVKLGAQNLFYEDKGAYTGEVAPPMLAGLCEYVIIGHSERRQYFGETDEIVDKKLKAAIKNGLKPIFCIGEKLEENESGKTELVLLRQLLVCSDHANFSNGIIIAYEPVWAIGTGRAATAAQAEKTIAYIRRVVTEQQGGDIGGAVRILYGGSVTAANIAELMKQLDIDGALVGGASLKVDDFVSIARQASEIKK
ncbi:MAG TPA: triose-phosphate isomerase [Dehalococcoidales bacterium]|nr:triose-phosphate isomerase [Dehalococcoidales bacterium]